MKRGLMSIFATGLAIDFGTVNTVIALEGRGIVLREPSAVAVSKADGSVLAIGRNAMLMAGRAPDGVEVKFPMRDGVVTEPLLAEGMLRCFVEKALGRRVGLFGTRLILCMPMCVTGVEKQALMDSARCAKAMDVTMMDEPVAAAIGAGLPVFRPMGSMIVDIGGGTTDVAVTSMGGVAAYRSVRTGGTHIDEAIMLYIAREHGLDIGLATAEDIKRTVGGARYGSLERMSICGRARKTGLPKTIVVSAGEISYAMKPVLTEITNAVLGTLSDTPPELSGDVLENGITLSGGGALINGLDGLIAAETGISVHIAESPLDCVAAGALAVLEGDESYYNVDESFSM